MRSGDHLGLTHESDVDSVQDVPARQVSPRVIVPLDGSPLSEQALGLGQALARLLTGSIELVHVVDPEIATPDSLSDRRAQATQYLAHVAQRIGDDIPVRTDVITGSPVESLLEFFAGSRNTLAVMSTHGRSGLRRFLFGSVADKLIRGAQVPVALVRDAAVHAHDIRQLLVPLDGSALSATALPLAMALARDERPLGLVRVVDVPYPRENVALAYGSLWGDPGLVAELAVQAEQDARMNLENVALRLRAAGCRVGWEMRAGRPSDEIIRMAETTGTDLIVMATHGLGGLRRWAFGSVTDDVVHRSHIPVLVIPANSQFARPG
ncbi:MAG TPA: universal stress protein [Chloroflexota bacterium]|nr:universal stress protein [Chloroflexota bacterium]